MIKSKVPQSSHTEEKSLRALENRLNGKISDAVDKVNDVSTSLNNFSFIGRKKIRNED
jgi:hypothetical protein